MRYVTTQLTPAEAITSLGGDSDEDFDQLLLAATKGLEEVVTLTHTAAVSRHWWHDAEGTPTQRNLGEIIALIHSELSEGLEAARKDLQSDHITDYTGLEEELADAIVRICDLAGALNLRLGDALVAKVLYNLKRTDHDLANRQAPSGKQF